MLPLHVELEQIARQDQRENHERDEDQDGERKQDDSLLGVAGLEEIELQGSLAPGEEEERRDDDQQEDHEPAARRAWVLSHGPEWSFVLGPLSVVSSREPVLSPGVSANSGF